MQGKARPINLLAILAPIKGQTHQLDDCLIECVEFWVLDSLLRLPACSMCCGEQQRIRVKVPAR